MCRDWVVSKQPGGGAARLLFEVVLRKTTKPQFLDQSLQGNPPAFLATHTLSTNPNKLWVEVALRRVPGAV